jgi:hypothetical protein
MRKFFKIILVISAILILQPFLLTLISNALGYGGSGDAFGLPWLDPIIAYLFLIGIGGFIITPILYAVDNLRSRTPQRPKKRIETKKPPIPHPTTNKPSVSLASLGLMTKSGNIKEVFDTFNRAGNWDTREWAVVSLQNMISDDSIEYNKKEMVNALKQIVELCELETGGGTYRTSCLDTSKRLLKKIEKEEV